MASLITEGDAMNTKRYSKEVIFAVDAVRRGTPSEYKPGRGKSETVFRRCAKMGLMSNGAGGWRLTPEGERIPTPAQYGF